MIEGIFVLHIVVIIETKKGFISLCLGLVNKTMIRSAPYVSLYYDVTEKSVYAVCAFKLNQGIICVQTR